MNEIGRMFYSYLNLESTKTSGYRTVQNLVFYSYLNLESTKTISMVANMTEAFYSYLNLESTKTTLSKAVIVT